MAKEPEPSEFGGEGYEVIQHGHRFDCENQSGHEKHVEYSDNLRVSVWDEHLQGSYQKCEAINGHNVKPVQRTIIYGPWEDV